MKASIINIGDEILIGQIINTNAAWMAQELNKAGILVDKTVVIADEKQAIIDGVEIGLATADIVLLTGGLGPTKDDITKKTLADYFGMELEFHPATFQNIEQLLAQFGREIDDRYKIQAYMPVGAQILINETGTASGMWFEKDGKIVVSMPGVPREVKYLMSEKILPKIQAQFHTPTILHHTLMTTGKGETDLSEMLEELEASLPNNIKLAYLPNTSMGAVRLRLSASGSNAILLRKDLDDKIAQMKAILGTLVFGENEDTLEAAIGRILLEKGLSLGTAESCTGGKIAHKITSIAGSSAYYPGSVVAYSNPVKMKLLKVKATTLETHGAVSEQCVLEMARGTQDLFGVDCAIAVSGIAGPGGARPGKPVGTIWVAVAKQEKIYAKKLQLSTERLRNITMTTNIALDLLRRLLIDDLDLE